MKKNVIKKDLLRRKIKEYFSKNPDSETLIVKTNIGESKTIWRVTKKDNKYNIIEVNTQKEEYQIKMEDDDATNIVTRRPTEPTQKPDAVGGDIWDPNNPNGHFQKYAQTLGLQKTMGMMPPDKLKKYFGMSPEMLRQKQSTQGQANANALGMKPYKGTTKPVGSQASTKPLKPEDKKKENKQVNEAEEPELKKKVQDEEEVGFDLESNSDEQETDVEVVPKNQTEEQAIFTHALKGHTIKNAAIEVKPDGGLITLDFVSLGSPVEIAWNKYGKVVFTISDRPYIIKK